MKNFLDLLAIDPVIEISMRLTPIVDNGVPTAIVTHNNLTVFESALAEPVTLHFTHLHILDPLKISVELKNKKYNADVETAIIVDSLMIDNFELVPQYTHLLKYVNDHNNTCSTNYLGFNGVWTLDTSEPFYHWKHKILGNGWLLQ